MRKYIAGTVAALSLIWIIYVGINIASSGNRVSPGSVFAARENVLVLHFPFPDQFPSDFGEVSSSALFTSIMSQPERVQHLYLSESSSKILLERSKPWTVEIIRSFFRKINLTTDFTGSRSLKLSNGWVARFDKEFLLISEKEPDLIGDITVNWDYIDRKSSFSLITWKEAYPSIENVYSKANGALTYISNENRFGRHLANDKDLFADVIPAGFSEYRFYEKNYLRTLDESSSLLYGWMNKGIVTVTVNGNRCLISDFMPSQDPIAILGDALDEKSINSAKTSGYVLNTSLPHELMGAMNWYVEVFNSRVFISEKKEVIDELIGAYEAGRTLTQDPEKYASLFADSPSDVSFRSVTGTEHKTVSLLSDSRHSVVQKLQPKETGGGEKTDQLAPVRIDGGIAQIFPVQGSDFLYVISKTGTVYGIQKENVKWQVATGPSFSANELHAPFTGELMVTSANEVHVFTRSGEKSGFPFKANSGVIAATAFSWKGQNQLAIADKSSLLVYNQNGRLTSAVKLPFTPVAVAPVIWVNRGELMATYAGEGKAATVSVEKKRKAREIPLGDQAVLLKTEQGPVFYYLQQQNLVRSSWAGETKAVASGFSGLQLSSKDNNQYVLSSSSSGVSVFDVNGNLSAKIRNPFPNPESVSLTSTNSGRIMVGFLDGLTNTNRVLYGNGSPVSDIDPEGTRIIQLHRLQNGSIQLLSQLNGYLVRYPLK